jgi:DNA-binding LytR/AlgR family response regulator
MKLLITTTTRFGTPLIIGIRTKPYSNEILFFEGDANYTRIHFLSGKPKLIARTLLYIQQKTDSENFTRISRKHLVNRKFIVEIGADFVVLSDKTILPIARRRKREFLMGESASIIQ